MTNAIDQLGYQSEAFAPGERFAAYRALYSGGADVSEIGPRFHVDMNGWKLDRALLYDRVLRDVAHERDAARVRRDSFEHFTLTLNLAGDYHADGGAGYRRLAPGEIMLMDMTRPSRNRVPGAHIVTLSMARDRIERVGDGPRSLHGHIIPADRGFLLAAHMAAIARRGRLLTPAALMTISRVSVDLLGVALVDRPDREFLGTRHDQERIDRVRAYIEERLFDPVLDPEAVIAHFSLSRATLYRDFQPWGGLARYTRIRRAHALAERLADPAERRPLSALAELVGFSNEARSSEAFVGEFGMRPGEYRRIARGEPVPAQAQRRMREWQTVLR